MESAIAFAMKEAGTVELKEKQKECLQWFLEQGGHGRGAGHGRGTWRGRGGGRGRCISTTFSFPATTFLFLGHSIIPIHKPSGSLPRNYMK